MWNAMVLSTSSSLSSTKPLLSVASTPFGRSMVDKDKITTMILADVYHDCWQTTDNILEESAS